MTPQANNARNAERMKQHQSLRVPILTHPPFLQEPASFGSPRTRSQLDQSQAGQIIAIPAPKRSPSVMELGEVIGAQSVDEISQSGQLVFHSVGDTGFGGTWDVDLVAQVMAMDLERPNPADRPAFFFHLGDLVYNHQYNQPESKKNMYEPQFYVPYGHYTAKILAIPGNHDSNPQEDPDSIGAFQDNFCADPPKKDAQLEELLNSPIRAPMYQPGVYYRLDAPFLQILALFSNGGEQEGVIRGGVAGDSQWNFLTAQLTEIKADRDAGKRSALIVAMHHPPFSGGGGHSGSSTMLNDLDAAFKQAGVGPDAVLSGHAHVYQRFTRTVQIGAKTMQVPYVVAGMGGHGPIQPVKPNLQRQPVRTPLLGRSPNGTEDHSLQQYFNGFGHLILTVTNRVLTLDLIGTKTQTDQPVDSVTVDLGTNRITNETPPFSHPANGEEQHAVQTPRRPAGS
jgi:Calcineurin-like phosphoesterase